MRGRGRCKIGLEEEKRKIMGCGVEEREGDEFLGFKQFWLRSLDVKK